MIIFFWPRFFVWDHGLVKQWVSDGRHTSETLFSRTFLMSKQCPNSVQTMSEQVFGHCSDIRNFLENAVSGMCRSSKTHFWTYLSSEMSFDSQHIPETLFLGNFDVRTMSKHLFGHCLDTVWTLFGHCFGIRKFWSFRGVLTIRNSFLNLSLSLDRKSAKQLFSKTRRYTQARLL